MSDLDHFTYNKNAPPIKYVSKDDLPKPDWDLIDSYKRTVQMKNRFPTNPVFFKLPDELSRYFICPSELNVDAILRFTNYWFNTSPTQVVEQNGKHKNIVFKSFYIWTLERDLQRIVLIQGNNKDNFYVLAYFDELDKTSKIEYGIFLRILERSYAEKYRITQYLY